MILFVMPNKLVFGKEAYFDLSDQEIQIQTDFNGKEVIIFGLTDSKLDTLLTIKGPQKDTKINKIIQKNINLENLYCIVSII